MSHIQTSYHRNIFNQENFARTVKRTVKELDFLKHQCELDAIVFRGVSGSAVAYPAAFFLGLNLIHIRKEDDDTHSRYAVEGLMGAEHVVIVDDFVSTGQTLKTICAELQSTFRCHGYRNPTVEAVLLYKHQTVFPKTVHGFHPMLDGARVIAFDEGEGP